MSRSHHARKTTLRRCAVSEGGWQCRRSAADKSKYCFQHKKLSLAKGPYR